MCHLKWCVVFSVITFIPVFGASLENRVSYLEYQLAEDLPTFKRNLFELERLVNRTSKREIASGEDVPDKLAERVKQMEENVEDFSTKQQKDFSSLRAGFVDLKHNTHDQFKELKALATNKDEINSIREKVSNVVQKIENEEKERAELKREMNNDIKSVIDGLNATVSVLRAELEKMIEEKQNVSATSIVVDGRDVLSTTCPDDWIKMDRKCYLYNPDDHLDWHAATVRCSMVGGKLVEPETAAEMKTVLGFAGNNVWVGGTDAADEGTWIWDSSQNPAGHLIWENGQPNNLRNNQHCLEVYRHQLNDENCASKNEYICERKAS